MRFLGSIFSFVMFLLFAVCFLGYVSIRSYENPSDLQKNITFMVEKGDGVKKISKKLHENNIFIMIGFLFLKIYIKNLEGSFGKKKREKRSTCFSVTKVIPKQIQ